MESERTDRTDEILGAIAALADRVATIEARVGGIDRIEQKLTSLEVKVDRIDQRVNAIARHLLAPAECIGLGIADARSIPSGLSGQPAPLPRAAKGAR